MGGSCLIGGFGMKVARIWGGIIITAIAQYRERKMVSWDTRQNASKKEDTQLIENRPSNLFRDSLGESQSLLKMKL